MTPTWTLIEYALDRTKLLFQPETDEHHTNTRKQNTPHKTPYICMVDDAKVDINWSHTRSKLIIQPGINEYNTKTEK
jgi:hypothetical protein